MIRVVALAGLIVLSIWSPVVALLAAIMLVVIHGICEEADRARDVTVDLLVPRPDPTTDTHRAYGGQP